MVLRDLNYMVWDARWRTGVVCDAFGFTNTLGALSGLFYTCSFDLYCPARIEHDRFLRREEGRAAASRGARVVRV